MPTSLRPPGISLSPRYDLYGKSDPSVSEGTATPLSHSPGHCRPKGSRHCHDRHSPPERTPLSNMRHLQAYLHGQLALNFFSHSLTAGNWLEWSRHLLRSLTMTQLDEYPLGLLCSPPEHVDPLGHCHWHGNDHMILGFMQTHMYSAEVQHTMVCNTSAEVFCMLCICYEKCSGLMQLQLIHADLL
jgi:hypothetical protein